MKKKFKQTFTSNRFMMMLLMVALLFTFSGVQETHATANAQFLPGGINYIEPANVTYDTGGNFSLEDKIRVKPSTTYTLSFGANGQAGWGSEEEWNWFLMVQDYNTSLQSLSGMFDDMWTEKTFSNNERYSFTFTTSATTEYLEISGTNPQLYWNWNEAGIQMQLEEGSSFTTWTTYDAPNFDVDPPLINNASAVVFSNVDNPLTTAGIVATLTATDAVDGDVTNTLTVESDLLTGNTTTLGSYNIQVSAHDTSNNYVNVTIEVRVVDTTDPIINLGASTVNIEYPGTYTRPSVNVTDNYDSSITPTITGTVNTAVLGTYTETINATDSSGNTATTKTITINVVDTTAPVQTLVGDATVYIEYGSNYTEQGVTITDNHDTGLTTTITGSVNVGVLGTYTLHYNVTDSSGNAATQVTRTIIVRDTTGPTITGTTSYQTFTNVATPLNDIISYTVNDLYDSLGSITVQVLNDLYTGNELVVGTYTVEVHATDTNGNKTIQTFTIEVIDDEAPIFSSSLTMYSTEYANSLTQEEIKDLFN